MLALFFATPLWAGDCPPLRIDEARYAALLDAARQSQNETEARQISNDLWEIWATAPDAHAQSLLDEGMTLRRVSDMDGAKAALDALIAYCPDYAEGYNQRAFVHFLQENYDSALNDLEETLLRQPQHIAAIAGKALTLIGLKRDVEAQIVLRQALRMNPWLSERRFLTKPLGNEL